jgi:hypothetical protein
MSSGAAILIHCGPLPSGGGPFFVPYQNAAL